MRSAAENQMTLYYQKPVPHLVRAGRKRAGPCLLTMRRWRRINAALTALACSSRLPLEELVAEQALADSKMGSFLLLRVVPGVEPVDELGAQLSAIRESDAAGLVDGDVLYLLMRQQRRAIAHYPRAPECKADCGGARRRRGHRGAAAAHLLHR